MRLTRWTADGSVGVLAHALVLALGVVGCAADEADAPMADAGTDAGRLTPPLELGKAIEAPEGTWTWSTSPRRAA